MIDLEKHAYMLQCYKCYKCYIRGISVLGIKDRNAFHKTFPPLRIIGKLVEKLPIILFPTFASLTKCFTLNKRLATWQNFPLK